MPVSEFIQLVGDKSLAEMSFRVAIANDLERPLESLDQLPAGELDDWMLLYDVEQEAARLEVANAERRK